MTDVIHLFFITLVILTKSGSAMIKMIRNLVFLVVSATFFACVKIDPFVESDEGKNILGLYLDGKEISYLRSGGIVVPFENEVYATRVGSDTLSITAKLDDECYSSIYMKFALADIDSHNRLTDFTMGLTYIYRKYPAPPTVGYSGSAYYEYKDAEFISGEITLRRCDLDAGVISGNFSFKCDTPRYNAKTTRHSITKGNFDVKLNDLQL